VLLSCVVERVEYLENIAKYLNDELQFNTTIPEATKSLFTSRNKQPVWKLVSTGHSVPQQDNGFDCGVFACLFAEYYHLGRTMDFTSRDIPFFRQRMALCLKHGVVDENVYEE
jgi:hypothetical protein